MVIIEEVKGKSALKKFMNFPNELYRDCEYYIPPLFAEEVEDWTEKNPAYSYCETKCFLAYKDGRIVGRIGAILSNKANEKWGYKRMRFSEVDFIDDYEVSKALFDAVEDYARKTECIELHGPLGFCDLDREGMLIKGFEERGQFFTYYNHPYYIDHLTKLGFVKDVDWVEYKITLPESCERIERLAAAVMKRYKLHLVDMKTRLDVFKYKDDLFKLLNDAYAHLYGVVPLNPAQIKKYTNKFIPLLDPRFTCIVLNENEELVAFGITEPSIALAIKKSNGRLLPFGLFRILKATHKNDLLDMFLVAVRPDMQGDGVNAILINYVMQSALKMNIKFAETGPMMESNEQVQAQWKFFEHVNHKTRRCFIKRVDQKIADK
ncbi:MAG: hypothetical protein RRY79_03325 [Clostridia bacterium]